MSLLSLCVCLLLSFGVSLSQWYYCDDEDECNGATMTGTAVYCRGYDACYGADIDVTYDVYCWGYQGCYSATVEANEDIACDGYKACKYATLTAYDDVDCRGRYACQQAELTAADNVYVNGDGGGYYMTLLGADKVYCRGYIACKYADINKTTDIYAHGYLSLMSADIESTDVTELTVEAYGYRATYFANIYCYKGSTCSVDCDGTGCAYLVIYCYDGATCKYTCDSDCDDCPTITESSSLTEDLQFNEIKENRKDIKTRMKIKMNDEMNKFIENGKDITKEDSKYAKEFEKAIEIIDNQFQKEFEKVGRKNLNNEENLNSVIFSNPSNDTVDSNNMVLLLCGLSLGIGLLYILMKFYDNYHCTKRNKDSEYIKIPQYS